MSSGQRLPLVIARTVAERLIEVLRPGCERIAIAGSIRRQKPDVGDIELVAIPRIEELPGQLDLFGGRQSGGVANHLDNILDTLVDEHKISRQPPPGFTKPTAWGDRQKKFWLVADVFRDKPRWVQVDLFLATRINWGAIFCIRTGPSDFSTAFVTHLKTFTGYRQQDGVLVHLGSGETIPVPEEADYFRFAMVPWIPPEKRSVTALRRVLDPTPQLPSPKEESHTVVKALSLWQPWASCIAEGLKQYETRDWSTSYRGLLAIHAARRPCTTDLQYLVRDQAEQLPNPLPLGVVVCLARLVDVLPTAQVSAEPGFLDSLEYRLGDYTPGRYAWKLEVMQVYDPPIPASGSQGLWNWTPPIARTDVRYNNDGMTVTDWLRSRLLERAEIK